MHIEKNIIFNPENNNNHVDNNYFKDHQNLVMKKPTSEPFYPTLNKTNIPMTAFNDQSFYPNPINKGLLSNNNKNQKAVIPNNNMISPNIYNNFNPLAQNFASNFSTSLPLNNLYQNNTSINALLKELNITEEEIKKLIEDRNKARREQNFLEADRIRNFLKVKGIALMDEKGGRGKGTEVTTWKICKLNYNNVKTGDFYAYNNNGNAYNNEEGNNNIAFNGKFLKYNP